MKKCFGILICLMIVVVSSVFGAVIIPDDNLRRAVEEHLGKSEDAEITEDDMARLTGWFVGVQRGIKDLTGLEYAVNIEVIDLWRNEVTDLSPLEKLTNLKELRIGRNKVTSLSPIADLTDLELFHGAWNPGV